MCVIIILPPKGKINREPLFNAAANNWHSWGIVIRKDGKTKVYKEVPENGTHTDIDKIMGILDENIDAERYIHFRHNTRGETNLENAHPFIAYESKTDPVYFMHNGTFSGIPESETKEVSDTSVFNTKYLKPLLGLVKGNFQDELFKDIMFKGAWDKAGGNNRGVLISGAHDAVTIGSWTKHYSSGQVVYNTYNNPGNHIDFIASNDDYFKEVKRGPYKVFLDAEAQRIREENQKKVQEHKTSEVATGSNVVKFNPSMFRPDPSILEGLKAYVQDFNLFDDDSLADFGFCGLVYFESLIEDAAENERIKSVALFMEHVMTRFQVLNEGNKKLEDKLEKATKLIAELKGEERKVG